jgi:tRNA(fMet)-specific endonuclease VapC
MYILDTDTLTHLQKENPKVLEKLEKAEKDSLVGITIVTRAEVLRGRIEFLLKADNKDSLKKAQKLLLESEKLLTQLPVIQFEEESLSKFDELKGNSKFRKIGRADLLIASICLVNRAVLVTRNVKHFNRFPNLKVENWID